MFKLFKSFGGLIILDIVSAILTGVTLKLLWGWFIVPIFGLPPLSIVGAIGIAVIAGLMTHQYIHRDENAMTGLITHNFVAPVFALVFGGIASLFL